MNYRELCQDVVLECGIDRSSVAQPTTVANQAGDLRHVVKWVRDAYRDIQTWHDGNWRWMRSKFEVETADGTAFYAPGDCTDTRLSQTLDRFSKWRLSDRDNPPRIYLKSDGVEAERWLIRISWANYRLLYGIGEEQKGAPVYITVDPQDNLVLAPTPDDAYVVTGEYKMAPQILVNNQDEPEMPEQFHRVIVYEAMKRYAGFESANEVMMRAIEEGRPLERQLQANQLPRFRGGRALV